MQPTIQNDTQIRHYRRLGEGRSASWTEGGNSLPPSPSFLYKPPRELWIQGLPSAFALLSRLPEHGLAVVGTRHPQARTVSLLRSRVRELQGTSLIILSGLALGIDSVAHEEAIKAQLPTIAILGSALDDLYPRENLDLARRILDAGGLLVSEFTPRTPIERHFFLVRNRMIAGWSKATWVVEAGVRSGALNTANWSRSLNRDTYATPCFPDDPALAGNQNLILRDEATPLWATHTLGLTWSELTALGKSSFRRSGSHLQMTGDLFNQPSNNGSSQSDSQRMSQEVARRTYERGGARVEELLEWALASNWNPQRFFIALQCGLRENLIEDQNGILTALNPRSHGESRS